MGSRKTSDAMGRAVRGRLRGVKSEADASAGTGGAPATPGRTRVRHMPRRGEAGFTLVEVIVALILLLIVGTSAVQFAVNSIHTSMEQRQRSTALTLGISAMEKAMATVNGKSGSDYLAALTAGQTADDEQKAYDALVKLGVIDKDDASVTPVAVGGSGDGTIAVDNGSDKKVNGTSYTVYTLVSKCYRATTDTANSVDCVAGPSADDMATGTYSYVCANATECASTDSTGLADAFTSSSAIPKGAFCKKSASGTTSGSTVYSPMLRVTVVVAWRFRGGNVEDTTDGVQEVFTTTEYLDCSGESSLEFVPTPLAMSSATPSAAPTA